MLFTRFFPPVCAACGAVGTWACPHCFGDSGFNVHNIRPDFPLPLYVMGEYSNPLLKSLVLTLKNGFPQPMYAVLKTVTWPDIFFTREVLVIPAPANKKSWRVRGYNQAAVISRYCARLWGASYGGDVFSKPDSMQQKGSNRSDRFVQAREGIRLMGRLEHGASVILIDDVVTTGATVRACAELLKEKGITILAVFCLAEEA